MLRRTQGVALFDDVELVNVAKGLENSVSERHPLLDNHSLVFLLLLVNVDGLDHVVLSIFSLLVANVIPLRN